MTNDLDLMIMNQDWIGNMDLAKKKPTEARKDHMMSDSAM